LNEETNERNKFFESSPEIIAMQVKKIYFARMQWERNTSCNIVRKPKCVVPVSAKQESRV